MMTPMRARQASAALVAAIVAMHGARAVAPSDITVTAPRNIERSSTTGAPIETVTISRIVATADLDLPADEAVKQLQGRLNDAATRACRQLDLLYPSGQSDPAGCVKEAVDRASADAKTIILAAQRRKGLLR